MVVVSDCSAWMNLQKDQKDMSTVFATTPLASTMNYIDLYILRHAQWFLSKCSSTRLPSLKGAEEPPTIPTQGLKFLHGMLSNYFTSLQVDQH